MTPLQGRPLLGHRKYCHFFLNEHVVGHEPVISYFMSTPAKQMGVASPHWHGGPQLWWSNLTYVPVSYSTWQNPLISGSKGPNLPSVPGLRFRGPPTVPDCSLCGPPSRDAKEQKVTFQLSVPLSLSHSTPTPLHSRLGLFWESVIALPPATTNRGGESLVVSVYFVYNVKTEQGRVHLRKRLKSAASGFEHVTVFLCLHTHTHTHAPCL